MTTSTMRELTNADRCDRCMARAQVLVILVSGLELLFCQHHSKEHGAALIDQGANFSSKRKQD